MKANLRKVIIQTHFEPHNNQKEATMSYPNVDSSDMKEYIKNQNQINDLLKVFLEKCLKEEPKQKQACNPEIKQKEAYNLEPRDNHVFIPIPKINPASGLTKALLKSWIQKVMKVVCSTGFNMYLKGQMDYKQTKIYCSLNIMQNIAALNIQHKLSKEHFRIITKHLQDNVLPYLLAKYPMTNEFQINRKLEAAVKQIDNISAVQNSFFAFQNIIFEYRSSGNYNDLIMKMLNSIKSKTNSINQNNATFYQQFQSLMSNMFQKVEDMNWMEQKQQQMNFHRSYYVNLGQNWNDSDNKKKQKEDYKNKVKKYSSYQIGRKIPQSTPLYTQNQISNTRISLKHISQLRILVKWCEQLFQKYHHNFFSCSSDAVKVQGGDFVHHLLVKEKEQLDQLLSKQLPKIKKFLGDLSQFNYEIQPELLGQKMENQFNDYQKICGKYSYRMMYAIKTQIILYLNKLIHGLLKAAYLFYWSQSKYTEMRWTSPPNLLTFKIGDLLRCKFSSKQREILAIYNEIYKIHENNPKLLKIIKIKNRLKTHTNDILIIVRFKECFNCEIQLAIKSEVSSFIKCSNNFNHYLYELARSPLGPLAEICNVWMSQDQGYLSTFKKLIKKSKQSKQSKTQCLHPLEGSSTLNKSFICNQCNKVYLHNNYVIQHKQCKVCKYKRCAECLLQLYNFEHLKKLLFKRQNIKDLCLRLVHKNQPKFEGFEYGVSIFLESKMPIVKYFKVVKYKETTYLINKNNGNYQKIAQASSTKLLYQFVSKNIVIGLKDNCNMEPFESQDAIKSFILPNLILKETYQKEKDIISLSLKLEGKQVILDTKTCRDILMRGNEQHRRKIKVITAFESKLETIPVTGNQFPNLKTLILKNEDNDPLQSYQGIQTFKQLRQFIIKGNQQQDIPPELLKLTRLQTIKIQYGLCRIPQEFDAFQNLKILEISRCWLENSSFEIICRCVKLECLDLYNNNLTEISKKIVNLQLLYYFSVNYNQITSLPTQMFQLEKLKQLNVRANSQLQTIPPEINDSQIEFLIINRTKIHPRYAFQAINLRQIRAHELNCRNVDIPDNISNCTQLTALQLFDYKIQNISQKIAECKELKILYLQNNGLTKIPVFFQKLVNLEQVSLAKNRIEELDQNLFLEMHKLKRLCLNQNYLSILPDLSNSIELRAINVSSNKIKEIPEFISTLPYLHYINFSNNLVSVLPEFLTTLQNISQYDFDNCPIMQIKCMSWLKTINQQDHKFTKQYTFAKRDASDQMSFKESFTIESLQKCQLKGNKIPSQNAQEQLNKSYKIFDKIKARIDQTKIIQFCKITYRSTVALSHNEASSLQQFQIHFLKDQQTSLAQLKQIINTENKEAQIRINILELKQVPNITDPKQLLCWKCSKSLQYPFYWLKWQPGISFGCQNCVEQKANFQEHNNHFVYRNNSVLIPKATPTTKKKMIPSLSFGSNKQPQQKITSSANKHRFECCKCSKQAQFGGAKYVCLECNYPRIFPRDTFKPIEVCEKCINDVLTNENSWSIDKHDASHLWVRILYETKSLDEY